MPKNNKKKNHVNFQAANEQMNSDDEFSNDGASVYSSHSDGYVNGNGVDTEENCDNVIEKFEEKLLHAIENASEKSTQTRVNALQAMSEIFMHHYMFDFVDDRKITILDIVEKSLKRGKGAEQALAAKLASLLVIQLHGDEHVTLALVPLLKHTALDKTATPDARAKCCLSLALLHFLGGDDCGELISLLSTFESIFAGSYLKGDSSPSSATAEAAVVHSSALSSWGLLITLLPSSDIVKLIESKQIATSVKHLMGLLESAHLEVRMTAGETLALLLECGRGHDEEFLEDFLDDMIEKTKQLSTDSQKFRAKRDRKQQRSIFRDVLHYLEEDVLPEMNIKFGNTHSKEQLILDTWTIHHQYNSLCNALGSGMNIHLVDNEFIRDILQLGQKVDPAGAVKTKMTKNEKRLLNAATFKARTVTRGKNRDKRSDF